MFSPFTNYNYIVTTNQCNVSFSIDFGEYLFRNCNFLNLLLWKFIVIFTQYSNMCCIYVIFNLVSFIRNALRLCIKDLQIVFESIYICIFNQCYFLYIDFSYSIKIWVMGTSISTKQIPNGQYENIYSCLQNQSMFHTSGLYISIIGNFSSTFQKYLVSNYLFVLIKTQQFFLF